MNRIINALRYGDSETRKCIGSVIFFAVVAIVIIVIAGLTGKFGLFIIGIISAVVAIIISQTFTLVDDDYVAEVDKNGEKAAVSSVSVKRTGTFASSGNSSKHNADGRNDTAEPESDTENELKKGPQNTEHEMEDENRFQHYDRQMLKKVKRKYHVKKDHRPILIDRSESYKIRECPAFIWRVHNKVFILLLEKEPRKICISREMIHNVGYRPGIRVDRIKEYVAFHKENLITSAFSQYLPDYTLPKEHNDSMRIKNLYTIYPDIYVTNNSIANVMDLLYLNFMPQDKITSSDKLNSYFKRVYAANILYKDKVYSIAQYKDEVEKVLGEMTYAEMSDSEYDGTLSKLVKGHLISQEYADYYEQHRK